MKKKVFLLAILCCLLLTGCGKSSKIGEIIEENYYDYNWGQSNSEGIVCEEIKDAVSVSTTDIFDFFITSDGSLYRFNDEKLFSNNKNCIKVDYGNSNAAYILVNELYDKNNNLIYIIDTKDDNKRVLSVDDYETITGFEPHNYLKDINDDFDFVSHRGGTNIYAKDHTVFWYTKNGDNEKRTYEISSNEKILGLYGAVIKTDKNYYILDITNKDECEKYADIKCNVGFVKSSFNEIYDDIIFLCDVMLIDKDWHVSGHGIPYSLE